ncbi:MAG: serine O-acetyltransferase [Gammaproteobacteria bacterium]|jgi:serine O-acetyltransferase|nr:serine O-acetyltransferase [Gammaproteobacteria bacterium]|tara:strand:+ start:2663 stop:3448 length:786 start_codon:yes stop_codon:yes gene_type:complete
MTDELWQQLRRDAEQVIQQEPLLASYVYACILNHDSLASALSFILANKLSDDVMPVVTVRELFDSAFESSPEIIEFAVCDIKAVYDRDAAICSYLPVILYLKGFQSIQVHRLAHYLWKNSRQELALFIQSRNSEVFSVDIHPGCMMGRGIMFDHATGIVIGETSVIEDNVSILQQVTLGGTGNEGGDRHPKIKSGVLISAGAKVLGNIVVGEGAKVGAGSVVLNDVDPHTTVVGVPARLVGKPHSDRPAETMEQNVFDDEP